MTDRELNIRFELLRKYIDASIDKGTYQSFDYLTTYGFWVSIKYQGEVWHYGADETLDIKAENIEWIKITSKIGPSATMEVTRDEWEYLWSFYNDIWREKPYLIGNL